MKYRKKLRAKFFAFSNISVLLSVRLLGLVSVLAFFLSYSSTHSFVSKRKKKEIKNPSLAGTDITSRTHLRSHIDAYGHAI